MKTTVIHHSADFDGIFCREIARKFLPDAELIGWDYGDPKIPFPDGLVYLMDLSMDCFFDRKAALEGHKRLTWIDHHKSALEKYNVQHEFGLGYRIDGVAACRLAWQWFNEPHINGKVSALTKKDFIDRKVDEPLAVRLAGEYDIWDKRDPRAELFQHGLRSLELSESMWELLLVNYQFDEQSGKMDAGSVAVGALLERGEAVQYAKTQENASIIKRQGFDVEWEGLKFLVCNHAMFNSQLFAAGVKPHHDALLGFRFDGKIYHVSLYHAPGKEHHDLSLIAVKHGGGGHRGACGFRADKLPWVNL